MTTLFGHCLAAPGTKPDHYHSLCRREYVDQSGVRHVVWVPESRDRGRGLMASFALQIRAFGRMAWENVSGPEGALTPTPALTPHHSTTPRSKG